MGTIREVRKRDNRVVPFDQSKIADAIYKAIRSVGKGDYALAEELASAVVHFLEKKFSGAIPGIEDIQDQVETVLIETGHAEVAKTYILYRNKRAAIREALQVRSEGGPELVEDREGTAPWSKGRIVAALIREADMEAAAAEDVASAVERKVFASGIQRISTALVRELVDNELFERGFNAKLRRQAPIGLPKYNLDQIIFGTDTKEGFTFPKTPPEVRDLIADQILEQYALQEVYSPAVGEAHRDGRLFIHGLGDSIRLARMEWYLGQAHGTTGAAARVFEAGGRPDSAELFRRLGYLTHFASDEIRLRRPDYLFQESGFWARGRPDPELMFVRLAELQAAPSRAVIVLDMDLDRGALPWLRALADRPPGRGPLFHLRLVPGDPTDPVRRETWRLAATLLERGEPIEFLSSAGWDTHAPLPPAAETSALTSAAAKITINLPRAAYRSGLDRRGNVEREIEEVVDLAIRGHLERRRFIERLGASREDPLWDLLGRRPEAGGNPQIDLAATIFPIGLLGLNECVKFLTGHEFHQDVRAQKGGRRIVQAIQRKLQRDSRVLGLRLVLEESQNSGQLRRLEEFDFQRFPPAAQEIERGRPAAPARAVSPHGARYSGGVRMHRAAPVDPLRRIEHLAAYLDCVVPGALIDDSLELRSGGGDLVLSLIEEAMPHLSRAGEASFVSLSACEGEKNP